MKSLPISKTLTGMGYCSYGESAAGDYVSSLELLDNITQELELTKSIDDDYLVDPGKLKVTYTVKIEITENWHID